MVVTSTVPGPLRGSVPVPPSDADAPAAGAEDLAVGDPFDAGFGEAFCRIQVRPRPGAGFSAVVGKPVFVVTDDLCGGRACF